MTDTKNPVIEALKTPGYTLKELLEKHPQFKALESKPTLPLFGINTAEGKIGITHNATLAHAEKSLRIAQQVENDLGITPLAVVDVAMLHGMVRATPGILLIENLGAEGQITLNDLSKKLELFLPLVSAYQHIKAFPTLKSWLKRRAVYHTSYNETTAESFYFSRMRERYALDTWFVVEEKDKPKKEIVNAEKTFSAIRKATRDDEPDVEKRKPKLVFDLETVLKPADFSCTLRQYFLEVLYALYKKNGDVSQVETDAIYREILDDYVTSNLYTTPRLRIFNEESHVADVKAISAKVHLASPPMAVYQILAKMKEKNIQPVIVAEYAALNLDISFKKEFLFKSQPAPAVDPEPLIGYRIEDSIAFVAYYGKFAIEASFVEAIVDVYNKNNLGPAYEN